MSVPLLQVNDLKKHFPLRGGLATLGRARRGSVYAVDGVSFHIDKAETLALAAGEFVRPAVHRIARQPHLVHEPGDPCIDVG